MKEKQLSFPLTDPELKKSRDYWKRRAEVAEEKIDNVETELDKALCTALGHYDAGSDYRYCGRCYVNL